MRRWFVSLALAWGFTAGMVHAQNAAAPAQAPAQAPQVQIQVQPAVQIQIAQPAIARADIAIMPMQGPGRFAQSDAIVVGRVVAFEPMDVEATPGPNQGKANYRIAIVQITETIHGVKKDTQTVRVGFIAARNGAPDAPGGIGGGGAIQILPAQGNVQIQPGFIGGRRPFYGQMNLQMGQDGIFMLNKHYKENFYLVPNYTSFIPRENNANFDNEVKSAKALSKVMDNPIAALKADSAQDRVMAAALLINKYRNPTNTTGQAMKQEPIDAEESKLILKALGQADWTLGRAGGATPNAFELFNQLGLSQKDGYNPMNIRNQQDIVKAMQTWLTDNTDKYRIQKFVVDPKAKPGVNPVDLPPNGGPGGVIIRPGVVRPIGPINGKVQILPAPVPLPAPAQDLPLQVEPALPQAVPAPAPAPLPLRRE